MKFSPIKASEEIAEKYKRYLTTIFEIADKDYAEQLNQELSRKNVLYRGIVAQLSRQKSKIFIMN